MFWKGHCCPLNGSLGEKCNLPCSVFLLCFPVAVITSGTFMVRVLKVLYDKSEAVWSVFDLVLVLGIEPSTGRYIVYP